MVFNSTKHEINPDHLFTSKIWSYFIFKSKYGLQWNKLNYIKAHALIQQNIFKSCGYQIPLVTLLQLNLTWATTQNVKLRWLLARGDHLPEVPNIVIWLGNFWYFGELVAEVRWSLMRVGRNWRFHCIPRAMRHISPAMTWYGTLKCLYQRQMQTSAFTRKR